MCRLLAVTSAAPFAMARHLRRFAGIARSSREYQGHGWGCAWQEDGRWRRYRSLSPIWEEDLAPFGRTRVLMAHARSAFRDEGILVQNNMPFVAPPLAFVFNGELRGVRIAGPGRTGAEKLFRFLVRSGAARGADALRSAARVVEQRSRYVRALNLVIGGAGAFLVCSAFNEDEEYFTLYARHAEGTSIVCSRPYGDMPGWSPLANRSVEEIRWFS